MAHPVPASRSLDFFLDLGNLSSSLAGGIVVTPPNNEEYWKAKGAGTYIGWEWTVYNASQTDVSESSVASGSVYWNTVTLGLENGPEPLFGYKVSARAYQDVITETPGPPDEEGNPTEPIWGNTRTYPPQTGVTCKFTNSQTRIPPLWPRPVGLEGPGQAEWSAEVGESFSTVVAPRRFEGITLYGSDQETSDGNNPVIVGIAEGEARCVGFVENRDVLEVNFMPPGDYYVTLDTLVGYMRTPDDRIERLVNNNEDDPIGKLIPTLGPIAGRITYPEELPRSTPQNPIPIGTTYVQQEDPANENFTVPFPGFVGRHLWVFTDIEFADEEGNRQRDRFGNEIQDFRWMRSQRPEQVSGYNYVLVFDQAVFEYIQRLSGPTTPEISIKNPALLGGWFPTEPYDENANPPLYPYDTIPTFVPDERESVDVDYTITVTGSVAGTESLTINQTCLAPTRSWQRMLKSLLARAYYTNGMSRSYAAQPGYCNPDSPNFGGNQQDPYCISTGQS